jgi:hypothetical protein
VHLVVSSTPLVPHRLLHVECQEVLSALGRTRISIEATKLLFNVSLVNFTPLRDGLPTYSPQNDCRDDVTFCL